MGIMCFVRRVLLSLLAIVSVASAQPVVRGPGSVTGHYQLRMPEDAVRVARLSGKRSTFGRLSLHVTNRFTLEVGDTVRHGRYRVDDDHLTLYVEDGTIIGGLLRGELINLEGLTFEHGSEARSARRFPTDASTGRLRRVDGVLTTGDPSPVETPTEPPASRTIPLPPPVAVFTPDPVVPVVPPAARILPARRVLKLDDCAGVWTVRAKGVENRTQRMELKADGTFRFVMAGATSEGTWACEGDEIVLTYTKVDGLPLEEGASGKKRLPVADDNSAFQIDTYRYERATTDK